jgi:hypothetical protein
MSIDIREADILVFYIILKCSMDPWSNSAQAKEPHEVTSQKAWLYLVNSSFGDIRGVLFLVSSYRQRGKALAKLAQLGTMV